MAEGADPESKTEEATPRKVAEARKKGDVAKSPDVAAAMSLAGAAAVVLMSGGWFATSMAEQLLPFIAAPHTMLGGLDAGAGVEIGAIALWAVAPFLGVVMLATILGGVGGNVAQSGLIFTAEKLKPDWSKVNPMAGFKRIFGPDGLVQFIKTFLKLIAVGVICWLVLKPHLRELDLAPLWSLDLDHDIQVHERCFFRAFLAVHKDRVVAPRTMRNRNPARIAVFRKFDMEVVAKLFVAVKVLVHQVTEVHTLRQPVGWLGGWFQRMNA